MREDVKNNIDTALNLRKENKKVIEKSVNL